MITYLKMKRNEWKVKATVYGIIATFIDDQNEVFGLLQKIYGALKDIPADEFQKEFVSKLVEIIREENKDN